MARTTFPKPGAYIQGGTGASASRGADQPGGIEDRKPRDPRIRWLQEVRDQMANDRTIVTQEMRRNMSLYDDKHWETFGSNRRAPWKLPGVVNYCAWIADTKSGLMADNKPKAVFSTPRLEHLSQAELYNAAWDEWWYNEQIQRRLEAASKLAVIRKLSYLKTGFDARAYDGEGAIVAKVRDGITIYVNKEATSVLDAEILLDEYTKSVGEVYQDWPFLQGNKLIFGGYETEEEDESGEGTASAGQDARVQPAQSYVDPEGVTQHTPPYSGQTRLADYERDSRRCLIREVWTRPKGPQYETEVEEIAFTATGEVATTPKLIEFVDGHREPLRTCRMSNGMIYELPSSTVEVLKWAAQYHGGVRVIEDHDTEAVVMKKRRVSLYPNGRRMIAVGNVVADDRANPFAHGRFPYVLLRERPAVKYYPRCSIDRVASLQDCLNRIVSMIFDAAHLTANPIWRMPLNSDLADEDISNAPGVILREDLQSLKLGKRERGPDMPAYVMQYLEFIIRQIREMSGLTESATGGKFKGQQAAETVSMYQEAAGVAFRPSLRCVEEAVIELGYQFKGLVSQFYTKERIIRYEDNAGVEQEANYVGTRLTAPMQVQVKNGSMLPASPSARLNYAMQLINTPAFDIPELLKNLEEVGIIDSATRLLRRLVQEKSNPLTMWLIPALAAQQKKKAKGNGGRSARATTPSKAAERAA